MKGKIKKIKPVMMGKTDKILPSGKLITWYRRDRTLTYLTRRIPTI